MDSSMIGRYLPSVRLITSDTASTVPSAGMVDADSVYYPVFNLTIETNDVRFRWSVDPTQGATPEGWLVKKDTTFRVFGEDNIKNLRYISAVSGQAGVITVTPEH